MWTYATMLYSLVVAFVQFVVIPIKLKKSAKSGTKVNPKRTSYLRSSTLDHVEKLLSSLIQDQKLFLMPVSMVLVQAKAHF